MTCVCLCNDCLCYFCMYLRDSWCVLIVVTSVRITNNNLLLVILIDVRNFASVEIFNKALLSYLLTYLLTYLLIFCCLRWIIKLNAWNNLRQNSKNDHGVPIVTSTKTVPTVYQQCTNRQKQSKQPKDSQNSKNDHRYTNRHTSTQSAEYTKSASANRVRVRRIHKAVFSVYLAVLLISIVQLYIFLHCEQINDDDDDDWWWFGQYWKNCSYNLNVNVIQWIRSFLCYRKQRVKINGCYSE